MEIIKEYLKNPCGTLSIPYWKSKSIAIPDNMRIVHDRDFDSACYGDYDDEPYFRLYHSLDEIEVIQPQGYSIKTATKNDIPIFVNVINQSYSDLSVTYEQLVEYTKTMVYHPNLWVLVLDEKDTVAGCGIAEFDRELKEGILEWIQVLPNYRGKKVGQYIVSELLHRLSGIADFATVSGKINNKTKPECLYRKCGFHGNDIWHILTKK